MMMRGWCAIAIALLCAACNQMATTPVAPSASVPAPAVVAPPTSGGVPTAYVASIDANGGVIYTDAPIWSSTLVVTATPANGGAPPYVALDCGNGSAPQTFAGFIGLMAVSCSFPSPGTYTVTASVTARSGLTTSGSAVVTAQVRPATPAPPTTTPQPTAPHLTVSVACVPQKAGTATPCNVAASFGGTVVTGNIQKVVWEYGTGDEATLAGPLSSYVYPQSGTYFVIAHVFYQQSEADASASVTIP